ncbi:DUF5615 family PIN-like protein [Candidatus Curtissbacteria bacterium]|nr:DUF5615 family PIN-like protein [Candidatus Curtissbacteria bacterium]
MRRNKTPKRHPRKFRILLDSAFAKPGQFPKLSKKANVSHSVHDCHLPIQAEDKEIYQKAIEENRFVLTVNLKDFKKLVKIGKPGILGIESQLSNEEIDKLVTNFISGKDPDDFVGKAIKI